MSWDPTTVQTPAHIDFELFGARSDLGKGDLDGARNALISLRKNFPPDWPQIVASMLFESLNEKPEHWPLQHLAAHIADPGCGLWEELEAEIQEQAQMLVEHVMPLLQRMAVAPRTRAARPRNSRHAQHHATFLALIGPMEKKLGRQPRLSDFENSVDRAVVALTTTVGRSTLYDWISKLGKSDLDLLFSKKKRRLPSD